MAKEKAVVTEDPERAEKSIWVFAATRRRFRMLAAEWDCSVAEAADRCSKLQGQSTK